MAVAAKSAAVGARPVAEIVAAGESAARDRSAESGASGEQIAASDPSAAQERSVKSDPSDLHRQSLIAAIARSKWIAEIGPSGARVLRVEIPAMSREVETAAETEEIGARAAARVEAESDCRRTMEIGLSRPRRLPTLGGRPRVNSDLSVNSCWVRSSA